MNVNWNNLVSSINNGQAAYDSSGLGTPIANGNVGFYDFPMGDFGEAADDASVNRPNDFYIAFSRWGSQTDVVTK
jgi:hypothetical protein